MYLPRSARAPLAGLFRTLPVRGRWRLAPGLNRLFPAESVEFFLPEVGRLRVDLADETQMQIYWTGLNRDDGRIVRLMRACLPEDGVFLDVGANVGLHTLAAARHVAAGGGAVVAFEPHPRNFETLTHNIACNGLRHVAAHNIGLAETAEVLTCRGPARGGNWSLASHGEYSFEVHLLRLDDFLEDHPLPRLDLIKIDVEGAEVRVLAGARETIARYRPLIVFEVCPAWLRRQNTCVAELLETVTGLGYTIRRLPPDGLPALGPPVAAAALAGMASGDWTNLVAVPSTAPAFLPSDETDFACPESRS